MKKILILGGGISGLITAEKLLNKGFEVIIIEQDSVLGGLASSFEYQGKLIPKTYHHVLYHENLFQDLIKQYGFEKKLKWNDSEMCFWFNNIPYKLTKPLDILFFKPLDFVSKLRFVKLGIISVLKKNWSDLKTKTATEWLDQVVGKKVRRELFEPLAKIKFGALSSVSAAWLGARLHEAALNKEKYAYLKGGLQPLIDKLGENIKRKKGQIFLNATVEKIVGTKVHVRINKKIKVFESDKIVSSLPPPVLTSVSNLSPDIKTKLNQIKYQPLVCLVCGSKQLLTKYYWNVLIEPEYSFGGVFHHTALYPEGGINGEYLYYFFKYLDNKDSFYNKSDVEIKNIFLNDIKKIKPDFEFSWTKIFKIKYSSPIFSFDYKNLPIKLTDDIYLTGVYKEYPSTRTMNSAVKSGLKTANIILNEK